MRWLVMVSVVCLACFMGCEPPKPSANAKPTNAGPVVVSSAPAVAATSLSEAQKQQFVNSMLSAARGENPMQDFLDTDQLFSKTAEIAGVPATARSAFLQGTKQGYAKSSLSKNVSDEIKKGGSFHFLRYSKRDGIETAIFRFVRSDSGLSYMEFALPSATASNINLASDAYIYINSEWLSRTSADITLQLRAGKDPSVLNKLFRSAGFGSQDAEKFGALMDKVNAHDWRGVITSYAALPTGLKQSKNCLMFRYNAANMLQDNAELMASVEDLRRFCPNEPCIDFLSIDYFTLRKEFGKVMTAIDNLDKAVGGDPYLEIMRGSVSFQANDFDQAIAAGKRAAERDPTLDGGYFLVARAAQAKRDFAAVTAAFRSLQAMGKVTPADVGAAADFAAYAASPEFAAWRDGR